MRRDEASCILPIGLAPQQPDIAARTAAAFRCTTIALSRGPAVLAKPHP